MPSLLLFLMLVGVFFYLMLGYIYIFQFYNLKQHCSKHWTNVGITDIGFPNLELNFVPMLKNKNYLTNIGQNVGPTFKNKDSLTNIGPMWAINNGFPNLGPKKTTRR